MEKTIKLTTGDIIKWVLLFATVASAFLANQFDIKHLKAENEERKKENMELRIDLKQLRECQSATASEVSKINGKLDLINETTNQIKDAIIANSFGRNR